MQQTPKGLRLQIALLGRVNAGKSSFLNLVTGQDISITSDVAGTTTDVVEKAQELLPIGPVLWLDTAGFGDDTKLSDKRIEKTIKVLDRADVAVLVCEGDKIGKIERKIIEQIEAKKIPLIVVFNKADIRKVKNPEGAIVVNSLDKSSRDKVLNELKAALIKVCPEDMLNPPALLGDLAPQHGTVVMIVPIDYEAPKGRIILPQVQAIRDCLDYNQTVIVVKENDYAATLQNLKKAPDLVVCDSQVVNKMVEETPQQVKCTTFSVLMARLKGDLDKLTQGAAAIWNLEDGDRVLIAESCTHHAMKDDIGTVKIPNLLKLKTGKNLIIDHVSGCEFPYNLDKYNLVIQCGGCMQNRREILSRINKCEQVKVPITNYGICISELQGVLARVLEPFGDTYHRYAAQKERK
ncbi:MAG: [FeFe] hydrogenase H-cluster maturation GTPase HydF [Alphaproteobacteria bacterium]|nr:[FeFe] hydrogenase H-cluster maturation GTPase HydF [Alphaproteobacteria bacterium]